MSEDLDGMIAALAAEEQASREPRHRHRVRATGGERQGTLEGRWLYRFTLPPRATVDDHAAAKAIVRGRTHRGHVARAEGREVIVAFPADLGEALDECQIEGDMTFLLQRLRRRLEDVRDGKSTFCVAAADRALGLIDARVGRGRIPDEVLRDGRLNAGQMAAVEHAMGSNQTHLWGPPGTGKTSVVARIVEAHFLQGRRVLLVSNTNAAVDTALLRVAERLRVTAEFQEGACLRRGALPGGELGERFGEQVILDRVVARQAAPLRKERAELETEGQHIEGEVAEDEGSLALWRQRKELRGRLARARWATRRLAVGVKARELRASERRGHVAGLRADLEAAGKRGLLRRILSPVNTVELGATLEAAERDLAGAEAALRAARDEADGVAREGDDLGLALAEVGGRTQGLDRPRVLEGRLAKMHRRKVAIRARLAAINDELSKLVKQVEANVRVVATTAHQAYLGPDELRSFDAVVIDEASMMIAPLAWFVAGLSRGSVVVAGDFRQLPPIVQSTDPEARHWLARSAFETAGIPGQVERREPSPTLVSLSVQYRMAEPICDLVNDLFYPRNRLATAALTERGRPTLGWALGHLAYLDTTDLLPRATQPRGGRSRQNISHAVLVRALAARLVGGDSALDPGDIAVITPYREQAKLIGAVLAERHPCDPAEIAATVHRFQGKERSVIILDLTDAPGVGLGTFLRAVSAADDGWRLLNVAVSRAKHHLIVVGAMEFLRRSGPSGGILGALLGHLIEHGQPLDAAQVLDRADVPWIDGVGRGTIERDELERGAGGVFDEWTFGGALRVDLGRARESVMIACAFATARGTERWIPDLGDAVKRGVVVRLVTIPAEERGAGKARDEAEAAIRGLERVGVQVTRHPGLHSKDVVLDGRIAWTGSLNMLSHRSTTETMLRTPSARLADALAKRMLDIPRGDACPRPGCGGRLVRRNGSSGPFLGCTSFPGCKMTRNLGSSGAPVR